MPEYQYICSYLNRLLAVLAVAAVACLVHMPDARSAEAVDVPARADSGWSNPDELLGELEAYLEHLGTVEARFTQKYETGETGTGDFYLSRPGRMRFQYDSPNDSFVVADGTFIYFWDAELKQVSQAPIDSTLAYFLLRPQIGLTAKTAEKGDNEINVREVTRIGDEIYLTLELANDPAQGQVTVIFTAQPLRIVRWIVRDAQGFQTIVTMSDWKEGVELDKDLFYFARPDFGGAN